MVTESKEMLTVADRCHKLLQRSLSTNKDRAAVLDTLKRKLESSHSEDNDASFLSRVINCALPLASSSVRQASASRLLQLPWSTEIRSGDYQHSDRLWDPNHETQSTVSNVRDGLHSVLQEGSSPGRRGTKMSLRAILSNQGIHVLMAQNGIHSCNPVEFVLVFARLWLCVGDVFHTDNVSQRTEFLRQVRDECWVSDATRARIDAQLTLVTDEKAGQPLAGATWLEGLINNSVPSRVHALCISRLPWHADIHSNVYDASTPLTNGEGGKPLSEVWGVFSSTTDKGPGKQTTCGKRMLTRSRTVVRLLRAMGMVPDDHRSTPCHVVTDIIIRLWLRLNPEDATGSLRPGDAMDKKNRQMWWTAAEGGVQDVPRPANSTTGCDDVDVPEQSVNHDTEVDKGDAGGDTHLPVNTNGDIIAQVRGVQNNILGNWYTVFPDSQGVQFNDTASQRIDKLSHRVQGQEEAKEASINGAGDGKINKINN